MQRSVTFVLLIVTCSVVIAGEVSDSVILKTAQPAPSGFTSWSFFWTMPEIGPDATLEYVVLLPNGEEYYRLSIPDEVVTGQSVRSDFSVELNECSPEVYYGNDIQFMFTVDIGTIRFPADASFLFEFTELKKEDD